jgi:hypothetical protein
MLVMSPMASRMFDQLSLPARTQEPPFYVTLELDQNPPTRERAAEVEALAAAHPENAFLAYAQGWLAQRGKRYDEAMAAYERARATWPDEARIPNNLGNIEFRPRQRGAGGDRLQARDRARPALGRRALQPGPAAHRPLPLRRGERGDRAGDRARLRPRAQPAGAFLRPVDARARRGMDRALDAVAGDVRRPRQAWRGADRAAGVAALVREPRHARRRLDAPLRRARARARADAPSPPAGPHLRQLRLDRLPALRHRRPRPGAVRGVRRPPVDATTPEFGRLLLFKRRRETRRRQGHVRTAIAVVLPGYGVMAFDRLMLGWLLALATATEHAAPVRGAPRPSPTIRA